MFRQDVCVLRQNKNDCYYQLDLHCPEIAESSAPGQFVTISCGEKPELSRHILQRPFSIFRTDTKEGSVSLLYQKVGAGTETLSGLKAGDRLNVLGPLGNGWTLPAAENKTINETGSRFLIAAGGIGIAAVWQLTECLLREGAEVTLLTAGRSAENILSFDELSALGDLIVRVATDDGTKGHHGLITDIMEQELQVRTFDYLYTCGPQVMLRAVNKIASHYNLKGELSWEERMGCGVGACLACVCKTKAPDSEEQQYRRICLDGPIFALNEVIFDD